MTSEFENWLNAIKRFPGAGKEHDLLIPVFKANLEYIVANRWQGASSHSSTAVFMVLAREVGVSAKLLMGQCAVGDAVFDHSWVEVRGQIYDIAISNPVLLETRTPPVFAGKSLDGLQKPPVSYGVKNRDNLELEAQLITSAPFLKYMENFSEYRQGLWEVAKEVGKNAGLKLNVEKMRKKHADIQWQIAE